MTLFKKIVSSVVLASFLMSNVVNADATSYKLAVHSKVADKAFREKAQIYAGVMRTLKGVEALTAELLASKGQVQFAEETVFGIPITGVIDFGAAIEGKIKAGENCLMFKSQVNGQPAQDFYCLIGKARGKDGLFPMSMVPQEVMAEKVKAGDVEFTHDMAGEEEHAIINRHIYHEVTTENNEAIDPCIAKNMAAGNYLYDDTFVDESRKSLYRKGRIYFGQAFLVQAVEVFLTKFSDSLDHVDEIHARLKTTPLVIIPFNNVSELPVITIGNKEIRVRAHSSMFATYVFVPRDLIPFITPDAGFTVPGDFGYAGFSHYVMKCYIHEIGVACNLDVRVDGDEVRNILDEYTQDFLKNGPRAPLMPSPEHRAIVKCMKPVNLLNLELRNDYAAGKVTAGTKKRIFRSYMLKIIGLAIGMLVGKAIINYFSADQKPVENMNIKKIEISRGLKTRQEEIRSLIEQLATDTNKQNRENYARRLVELGNKVLAESIENGKDSQKAAAKTLGELEKAQARPVSPVRNVAEVKELIGQLNTYKSDYAKEALVKLGQKAVPQLIAELRSAASASEVRDVLHKIGEPSIEPLVPLLKDRDEKTRLRALSTLSMLISYISGVEKMSEHSHSVIKKKVLPALYDILTSGQADKNAVYDVLGILGSCHDYVDDTGLSLIIKSVKTKGEEIGNSIAVTALGATGSARGVPVLLEELRALNINMRAAKTEDGDLYCVALIKALGDIGPAARDAVPAIAASYGWAGRIQRPDLTTTPL